MPPETFLLLVAAAFLAGFVDAIAGGGGLVTIPALLLAGIDPVSALGTNKLQGLFGAGSASLAYASKGHVQMGKLLPTAALSFAGSAVGASAALLLPTATFERALPYLLIAIALYFALRPGLSDADAERRGSRRLFALGIVPVIGAYDGLFGPGTGSFFMLAFVTLAGFGILKATAHTKLLNFASNLGAFTVFALSGSILWTLGLCMGVAQFAGAKLGATFAMRFGAKLIRPLLVCTCLALAAKLLLG
ncbi:TSUP family transporter [Aureimonas leprariae]|uniref:Probable membrane transporter protein n=1 Tax=Plantimonas leprariae TaxID=2615207 RepID=A0A7V7PP86_9HYPH|nr:TSUP family transporter [Aureimonas leprariae]KAB0679647.1 TSUP family transporter [Aureimonas leprariae]